MCAGAYVSVDAGGGGGDGTAITAATCRAGAVRRRRVRRHLSQFHLTTV